MSLQARESSGGAAAHRAGGRSALTAAALLAGMVGLFAWLGWIHYRSAHALLVADVPVRALAHVTQSPEAEFPERFALQVAVLRTDAAESVLPVIHALKEAGVPFFVTRGAQQALRHRLILIYPHVRANSLDAGTVAQLRRHVEEGGSILAQEAEGQAAEALFGVRAVEASKRRHVLRFERGADAVLRYLNRPEELEVRLGAARYAEIFWTAGYTADGDVLARFDDGSAALLRKRIGKGTAYLSGVSLMDGLLRSQVNRHFEAFRQYVNAFEPGGDVWVLLLRAWYEMQEPGAVRLVTMPNARRSVLLLTHDVDWSESFEPMLAYADAEAQAGTRSLFFVQTKYVSDANSRAFFYGDRLDVLRELHRRGFPLGSHSVIHSRAFNTFALGSGQETYVRYHPRGTGPNTAADATVFGEVRVSRELLDGNVPGQQTAFFRAGHLRVPKSLPEALARCGYAFDSSFTAPDVLSNFPYALPLGLEFQEDSGIYEFPVAIEDEEPPVLAERIPQALEVIAANAENGAPTVVLIHSNEARRKLEAERALLAGLPAGVRPMDPLEFARFWRARDRLGWSVAAGKHAKELVLTVESAEAVRGITFEFAQPVASVTGGGELMGYLHLLVLPSLEPGRASRIIVHLR